MFVKRPPEVVSDAENLMGVGRQLSSRGIARANRIALVGWAAVLLLVCGLTWDRLAAVRSEEGWVRHTYEVLAAIKDLEVSLRDAESGQRGYVMTGDERYLQPYTLAVGRIGAELEDLRRLTVDNAAQQAGLRALALPLQQRLDFMADVRRVRDASGFDRALALIRTGVGHTEMLQTQAILTSMTAEEQGLLDRRLAATARHGRWLSALALAGAALALLALAWSARSLNSGWIRSRRDEEEQRTLALRLRASLDSLSQGVAVFDADGLLTNRNERFQVLLRLPGRLVAAGIPYASLVAHCAEPGPDQIELESEAQISGGGARSRGAVVTYERSRPDGDHLELRRTSMPGEGFVLTVSDMTKRMQAEAVLREAQKMQAIGQLTGGIAHDFNNLLTVILGNLETVQRKLPEDHVLQARIGRAVWAAQRGASLTAQLLAFARRQPLAPAPIDLSRTVPELVPLLARTLGERIEVRFVGSAGPGAARGAGAPRADPRGDGGVDARDAMPDGGRLTLELANKVLDAAYAQAQAEVTAGDYVMLAVSDTGQGMTAEVAARVFEPFFTTKPDGQGTGLGLAMVFGFIKQSRGHVKIYSEPGQGTSVKLYLPRAIGGAAAPAARSEAPIELARAGTTLLVVEDEPSVREITVAILRDYGYQVFEAAAGQEAMALFDAHGPGIDMLISDVVLPGALRGRELAERITALRPEVKILFMSGYTENSIVHHGRLDDGVQLISKPFQREQLAAKVAELLGLPAVRRNDMAASPSAVR